MKDMLISITVTDGENEYNNDFYIEDKTFDEFISELEEKLEF